MHILQVVHQFPPEHIGGTEYYTQWLSREMIKQGHDVSIFHRGSGTQAKLQCREEDGIRIWTAQNGPMTPNRRFLATFGNAVLTQAFTDVLEKEKPDLVHIQHLMGLPRRIADEIRAAGIPYVVTLHDYYYFCANAQLITNYDDSLCDGPNWWLNCGRCAVARAGQTRAGLLAPSLAPILGVRNRWLRAVLSQAACVIAPTQFVKNIYGKANISTKNIRVITHGIPKPDEAQIEQIHARKYYEKPPLRLGYIGGIDWQKGLHVLVTAVNQLPHDTIHLTIYGDTKTNPAYVETLNSMIQHANIHFAGRIPRDQIWSALAEIDLIAIPSLWYETSSLIIQEAFAADVPVMASRLGGMVEKIENNVNGLLVDPGSIVHWQQQLSLLIDNPNKLAQFRNHIPYVQSIAEHVDDIESVYQQSVKST